jgi:general secretion pathway protein M
MNASAPIAASSTTARKAITTSIYVGAVCACALATWGAVVDIQDGFSEVAALQSRLRLYEGRAPFVAPAGDASPRTSPFLEGDTVEIGGAALQKRVADAVRQAGGAVVSTELALDGADGALKLTGNIEIAQAGLQALLYDLETGAPYVFVDKLSAQSPRVYGQTDTDMLRVALVASGKWRAPQ